MFQGFLLGEEEMQGDYTECFRVFAQVSKVIHTGENTAEILDHVVRNIKEILGAKGCIYRIVDQGGRTIETMVSSGFFYRNLSPVDDDEPITISDPDRGGDPARRTNAQCL